MLAVLAIFALHRVTHGLFTAPGDTVRAARDSVTGYATRPEASWRQAANALESVGAAREGDPAPEFDLSGRVVRVADGDTVSLLDAHNTQHKVRLYGIDTPEQSQPYGRAAKNALRDLVSQQSVGVVVVTTDTYGRKVGTLYHDGVNINAAMVASGYAWWYQHFAPYERKLAAAEEQARRDRLGLWADPHPVPPWDWRRGQRAAAKSH